MKNTLLLISLIAILQLSAQNISCNCCSQEQSQFDFWVGSWLVTNPDGSKVGENSIEKLQNN
jgi:hypothetical protein